MRQILRFCFKEHRNYVQGPDIYNSVCAQSQAWFGNPSKFSLVLQRKTGRNLDFWVDEAPSTGHIGTCSFYAKGARQKGWLIESSEAVNCRVPYAESEVVRQMKFDDDDAYLESSDISGGYTPMELFVSMNKALHLRRFDSVKGSWLFVRADTPSAIVDSPSLPISVKLIFAANTRMTKSEIFINSKSVGFIYFALAAA
jgi:hypothetical protein